MKRLGPSLADLRDDDLVRAEDVGRFLGCSARTVMRAQIPFVAITPRVRRYRVRDLRRWIDDHVRGVA